MKPQHDLNNITVGCRVTLEDKRTGVVRFIGPVHFRPGVIAGVELDDPHVGTSDGSVNGWRYFDAPDQKAVFVKKAELIVIDDDRRGSESISMQSDYGFTPRGDDIQMDPIQKTGNTGTRFAEPSESFDNGKRGPYADGPMDTGYNWEDEEPVRKPSRPEPRMSDVDMHDDGKGDEDDKYARWKRGMAAALEHELLDYKSDPDDTGVCVNYALKGLPHEEIAKIPKSRLRNAICKALPPDLRDKIDPKQLKITFEELDDYTEMKVQTDAKDPEQADDLKWTMLDPVHVRKFNEELKNDQETDLMNCEYTYLERREDGCCRWVKPCIACICCWLLLLTLLLGLLFSRLTALSSDVDELKNQPVVVGGADWSDLKVGMTDIQIVKTAIDTTGSALTQCPDEDWELINCWVYLPNHWWMFQTYVDPDPSAFPDCSCYCQHKDDSYGCNKIGAECRAQCGKFGVKN